MVLYPAVYLGIYLGVALRHIHRYGDILQKLVVESVDTIELQDQVVFENVLDAADAVLCLGLSKLSTLAGLEQRAEPSHLWNCR